MRRVLAPVVAAATLVLGPVPLASAETATELCTLDARRGAVPGAFVLDACVDGASITLRNDLDVPVVLRADGDVGPAVRVYGRATPVAAATRLVAQEGVVLLPDDVVRWPLGPAAGGLTVTALQPAPVPAIANALAAFLPRPRGAEVVADARYAPYAAVVRATAAALEERAGCVEDKNFLEIAACDVQAAAAIGRASESLPPDQLTAVLRVVLDGERWADWSSPSRDDEAELLQADLRLAQAADPTAPPAVPTDPAASPAGGPHPAPAAAPAPVPRPAPVPAPAPAPVPAPAPAPAPPPPPAPAPAPAQPAAPAPAPPAPAAPAPAPAAPAPAPAPGPTPPSGPGAGPGRDLIDALIDAWRQWVEQRSNGRGGG